MIIYKVTNKINNKIYIGQTINSLEHRRKQHEKDCRRNKYYNNRFHNALIKYGFDNFIWECLCECVSIEELNSKEQYYISEYNTTDKALGYNLKFGGNNGGKCCDTTKVKISLSSKQKWTNPKIASKMLNGLRKGTETVKQKGLKNYVLRKCIYCDTEFKCKPYDPKKYCSLKCANNDPKHYLVGVKAASTKVQEQYQNSIPTKIQQIENWIRENKLLLQNVKMNNLTFIQDLCTFLNVKDHKTVAKILNVNNKKNLVTKLIEISKNIC